MVALEDPAPDPTLTRADHEEELSSRVESLLSEARTAGYAADSSTAEAALESAELLLRGHPALPEAPWLMAETCHDHALLVRAQDPTLASILEYRATVLVGKRARAFAESESAASPPPDIETGSAAAVLQGPLPSDEVDIDGVVTPSPRSIPGGEHHVRVLRRGRLAWAGWVTPDATEVRIPMPGVVPCSESDFADVRLYGGHIQTGGAVLCPRWAAAREVTSTRIEVATCERDACSTFLPWSRGWGADLEGPMQPPWPKRPSKTWIGWTAASVTALAVGAIVLWREGVFDRDGPPREHLAFTALPPP